MGDGDRVGSGHEDENAFAAVGGWPAVLGRLLSKNDLTAQESALALGEILVGAATPAQIAAFVTALRIKGETVEEMTGLVRAMLTHAEPLPVPRPEDVVDTVPMVHYFMAGDLTPKHIAEFQKFIDFATETGTLSEKVDITKFLQVY